MNLSLRNPAIQALVSTVALSTLSMTVALAIIAIASLSAAAGSSVNKDLDGLWRGTLDLGDRSLPILVMLRVSEHGEIAASIDTSGQGATALAATAASFHDDVVHLDIRVLGAEFEGRLSDDRSSLEGQWRQSGLILDLTLRKTPHPSHANR